MRLARIRLRNFRCYQDEVSIEIDDITVLVGKNDAGKSTIMDALAIFFDEDKLDSDDASQNGDKTDVRIICEFDDLPETLVIDANYPTRLQDEFLLNENGLLEIHKIYKGHLQTPRLEKTASNVFCGHHFAPAIEVEMSML
ncbi:MAG: AAA family ATPase [Anaerolineales bacterium]|nr:AAA family ATPase [Anaerolineales bacterium]